MGSPLLPDLGTEILIPVCAIIGIGFSLFQWLLVSKVKLTPGSAASNNSGGAGKNGHGDYLIEEEEGLNDLNIVLKCAEIQNAISEGIINYSNIAAFFFEVWWFLGLLSLDPCLIWCFGFEMEDNELFLLVKFGYSTRGIAFLVKDFVCGYF